MTPDTPHWTRTREEDPELHAVLDAIAETLLGEQAPACPLYLDVPTRRALELGHLVRQEGTLVFTDSQVRDEYLVRRTVLNASAAWDDVETFTELVERVWRAGNALGADPELAARTLVMLAAEGRDITGRLGALAAEAQAGGEAVGFRFWSFYSSFCAALPHLAQEPEDLAHGLRGVRESVGNDFANGQIHSAVRDYAARSQDHARRLLAALVTMRGTLTSGFAADVILSLARFDRSEAHRSALALSHDEDATLRGAGIRALGDLPYEAEGDDARLATTLRRLDELFRENAPDVMYLLPGAYRSLLPVAEAADALTKLAGHATPGVQQMTALALLRSVEEYDGAPWLDAAVRRILGSPSLGADALRYLDGVLMRRARTDPDVALAAIETWAASGGLRGAASGEPKLPGVFPGALGGISVDAIEAAITRWFSSDDRLLHRAASEVVGHHLHSEPGPRPPLRLSLAVLGKLDESTVRLVVLRILAYVVGGQQLAVLLVSALRRDPCSPTLAGFVGEALAEAVYNYPGGAGGYMRLVADSTDSSELQREAARGALEREETYLLARRNLPQASELAPPSSRTIRFKLAQRKHHAEIMDAAENQSVIMQLVQRVTLKYGRAFAVERDGVALPPQELNTFSHEVEIPRGELADPLGERLKRMERRSLGLRASQVQEPTAEEPGGEA